MDNTNTERTGNIICGRNPVLEAVRSGREIDRLLVAHGVSGGSVTAIIAKCRAKGVQPRRVLDDATYKNVELSEVEEGITAAEIEEAKARRAYSPNGVNVWRKDRTGFYI